MSAWPANSRTSCIVAPLRMASLIAVLRKRVDADAAAAQPRRVDPGRLAVFLDQPPGGLAVEVPPLQAAAVRRHRPEERPFPVLPDAGSRHVGQDRPGGVEQDLPPLLVPLLGDVEVVLDAVGLQVADAGPGHRRDPAAGQEEHAHQRQVADALQGVGGDGLQQGDRLPLGQRRRGVLLDAGGLDGGDVLGRLPGDQPLGRELLVGAAEHRQPPGHRGRRPCRPRAGPACRA